MVQDGVTLGTTARPTHQMIPDTTGVSKKVGEHQLGNSVVVAQQQVCSWNGMATKFTVVTVVLTSEPALRSLAKLGWAKHPLPLTPIAPEPPLTDPIAGFKRPRQILDLDHLAE